MTTELEVLDDTLDDLESRLQDVSARLDEIARALAHSEAPVDGASEPVRAVSAAPPPDHDEPQAVPSAERTEIEPQAVPSPEQTEIEPQAVPSPEQTDDEPSPRVGRSMTALLLTPMAIAAAVFALCSIPTLFGYRVVVVQGGSMGRAIPFGSVAFTRAQAPEDVRVGDVILVNDKTGEQAQYLHRVKRLEHRDGKILVRTHGDANGEADPEWTELDRDVPELAWSVPVIGFLMAALGQPAGWATLVLLPAALTCAAMLRQIWATPEN